MDNKRQTNKKARMGRNHTPHTPIALAPRVGGGGVRGRLVVLGTPIGNLGDFPPRGVEALRQADALAAEDTRRTRKLLSACGIPAPRIFFSCRAENEERAARRICTLLAEGRTVVLVSDAGMPAVSDPGATTVAAAVAVGAVVEVIPGPSAVTAAVAGSGFRGKGFAFLGFAPLRRVRVVRLLRSAAAFPGPIVMFESPHRMARLPGVAAEALGERECCIALELTKVHERFLRGTPSVLETLCAAEAEAGGDRGEVTFVAAPATDEDEDGDETSP